MFKKLKGVEALKLLGIEQIRKYELDVVLEQYQNLINGKDLLELGSGDGFQLNYLKKICKSAVGVDVEDGSCSPNKLENIQYYDGQNLPYEDESFDVVFSSNVLEHVQNIDDIEKEILRVLKPNGVAIHVLPSASWRIFTILLHYVYLPYQVATFIARRLPLSRKVQAKIPGHHSPKVVNHTPLSLISDTLMARRHGERGNKITEIYYFSSRFWLGHFKRAGWKNLECRPSGLFYANNVVGLTFKSARLLSKVFGSGTVIYKMEK